MAEKYRSITWSSEIGIFRITKMKFYGWKIQFLRWQMQRNLLAAD